MIKTKIEITKASQLKMHEAINYSATVLNRSLRSTLQQTSVFFTQSAAKLTPQSKKNRKFKAISKTKEPILFKNGVRFRIQKYSGKLNRWYWVYAKDDADKLRKTLIENRGLYKKIWFTMLPKLGKANNKSYSDAKTSSFARRSTRVDNKSYLKENPFIRLTYKRPEMNKIAPGIVPHALNKAKNRLIGILQNQVSIKLKKAWKRK